MDPIVITILVALAMIIAISYMFFKILVDRKKYLVASLTTKNATPEKFQDLVKYSIVFKKKNCKIVYLKIAQSSSKIEAYGKILYDKALKELQEILKDIFGEKAIICKMSDDVLAVFLNEDCEVYDLVSICNIAVERCSETMYLPEGLEITFSVNVAGTELEGVRNYDKLMLNLSIAMDTAVKNGPNTAYVYKNEVKLSSFVERKLQRRVLQGIKDLELNITYKPYFKTEDKTVKGVEVGLIWTPKVLLKPNEEKVVSINENIETNEEIVVNIDENNNNQEETNEEQKDNTASSEEPLKEEKTEDEIKDENKEQSENTEEIKEEQPKEVKEENSEETNKDTDLNDNKKLKNKKPKKKKKEKVKPVLFENITNQEDFDKLIEGSNLVNKTVTLWTFENSLKNLKTWTEQGYDIKLLMKLHLSQLFLPSLIKNLDSIIKKLAIPADKIVFQINSDLLSVRKEEQQAIINQIKNSGYQLNSYNFGIEDLQTLLFIKDTYKSVSITPKIMEESMEESSKKDIVSMILNFCKQEDILTVATHVETQIEEDHVKELNFDIIQGDYICKKTKEEEITKLLNDKNYKPVVVEDKSIENTKETQQDTENKETTILDEKENKEEKSTEKVEEEQPDLDTEPKESNNKKESKKAKEPTEEKIEEKVEENNEQEVKKESKPKKEKSEEKPKKSTSTKPKTSAKNKEENNDKNKAEKSDKNKEENSDKKPVKKSTTTKKTSKTNSQNNKK